MTGIFHAIRYTGPEKPEFQRRYPCLRQGNQVFPAGLHQLLQQIVNLCPPKQWEKVIPLLKKMLTLESAFKEARAMLTKAQNWQK
jgi:hypothetical protein